MNYTTESRFGYAADGKFVDLTTGLPPTEEDHAKGDAAYYAMTAADKAWHEALTQKYGERAGTMRYRTAKLSPELLALRQKMLDAVEAWRGTWRKGGANA